LELGQFEKMALVNILLTTLARLIIEVVSTGFE